MMVKEALRVCNKLESLTHRVRVQLQDLCPDAEIPNSSNDRDYSDKKFIEFLTWVGW